ncbi:glycine receptor subunit alpha-4-like [Asterias rubens]|uniref:glycine receptor subunit alpha-4-like n=1 Tax=Asterias rubens TaxID=7604 RepID=UPI0014553AFE|nr:glycine receptor subunit alpha-4-like [Asterias rubens]
MNVKDVVLIAIICYCIIGRTSSGEFESTIPERNIELENKTRELFNHLLEGYDRKIRPFFGTGRPVNVTIDIYLASFDNIHEELMEYGVTIYLRQRWCDPRLRHSKDIPLPPTSHYVSHLWLPDLIFSNAKIAEFKDVTFMNRIVDIDHDGTVLYVSRIGLQLSCSMDFHRFPLDGQACEIEMESFEYTDSDLTYRWDMQMPIEYHANHLKLPQYDLKGGNIHNCSRTLRTGNFSCIGIKLIFGRKIGYYILQTYIPSILMVIMSWVSFWIEIKGSPARVALGVTTVLTMITTTNGARQNLPPVSYVKAIDVWFSVCLMFVIGALLEFALVHFIASHKPIKCNIKQRLSSYKRRQTKDVVPPPPQDAQPNSTHKKKSCVVLTIEEKVTRGKRTLNEMTSHDGHNDSIMADAKTGAQRGEEDEDKGVYVNHALFEMDSMGDQRQVTVNGEPLGGASRVLSVSGNCTADARNLKPYGEIGRKIDKFCRWAFPLAFVIFNFGYWIGYSQEITIPDYPPQENDEF